MVQAVSGVNRTVAGRGAQNGSGFGNIQRVGAMQNGRTVYRVIDSNGEEAGKLSVPNRDTAQFEKSYVDLMDAAPKLQKYVAEHSSEKDIKNRRTLSRVIVGACGLVGAAVPIYLTRKSSTLKQILCTVTGIVAGLSAGFATSMYATTPPGAIKFAKATRNISRMDIQPVIEN